MATITFSLGADTYDNEPKQCSAADFDDFVAQISSTDSTKKGQKYLCAPLAEGSHNDPARYRWKAHWRIRELVLPRRFLALDVDGFAAPEHFEEFQQHIAQWNALVYTTASHTADKPRARAIIELSREVDYDEGIRLGTAVQRLLEAELGPANIQLDASVYRGVQPVYVPLRGATTHRFRNAPLDVESFLPDCSSTSPSPSAATVPLTPHAVPGLGVPPAHVIAARATAAPLHAIPLAENPVNIARVQAALAQVSADCRYEQWIEILFALHSTRWQCAETLARVWSMTAPKRYQAAAFASVWRHAKATGGTTIEKLFERAQAALQMSPSVVPAPSTALRSSGKLALPLKPPPPRDYLVGQVLVPGTVAVMAGVGGTAKTTLALQLVVHGALGRQLGAIQIGDFASVLFLAEETTAERDRRLGALCTTLSASERSLVEQRVYCEANAGEDLRMTTIAAGNLFETALVDRVIAATQEHQQACGTRVGLIVLDHARLVMAGDPLAADHVTALLRALNRIAVTTNTAVLLLAHSPKSTLSKDTEADASEVFGSGAFVDHTRAAFVLHTMRESERKHFGLSPDEGRKYVSLTVVKSNYGPSGTQWWFEKEAIPGWQVIRLTPALLLPKGQTQAVCAVGRRIIQIIKRYPGQLSSRSLRDRYAGKNNELAASEGEVRKALERLLATGELISREPTCEERKRLRLPGQTKVVLDLPACGVASGAGWSGV